MTHSLLNVNIILKCREEKCYSKIKTHSEHQDLGGIGHEMGITTESINQET